jgi:hypothetical protein
MQVFGLPRHVIRNGGAASRLPDAKTTTIEAARRRDAVARWPRAMADGPDADEAARAVGVPRATLYRWETSPVPRSRREERDAWANWPARIAALMAAELGLEAHAMQKVLETHVRAHLADLAEVATDFR